MEKRLPLALFLSFLILFGWSAVFGPRREADPVDALPTGAQEPTPGATAPAGAQADGAVEPDTVRPETPPTPPPQAPPAPPAPPAIGEVVVGSEPWSEWIELGRAGEPGHFWARFDNRGGRVAELRLGGFWDETHLDETQRADRAHWAALAVPVETSTGTTGSFLLRTRPSSAALVREPLDRTLWQHERLEDGVRFRYAGGTGVTFTKTIRAVPGEQRLVLELELANESPELAGVREFALIPVGCVPRDSEDKFYQEPQAVCAWRSGENRDIATIARPRRAPSEISGPFPPDRGILFAGVHNKYFAVLLRGGDETSAKSLASASWRHVRDEAYARENPADEAGAWSFVETEVDLSLRVPAPDEATPTRYVYDVYAGPKQKSTIVGDYAEHALLVEKDLGFFSGIAGLLLGVLGLFESVTGNWGVAIILLTLTVRLLLFPVTRRSQVAMARHQTKMKRVQPLIEEAKKRYANDAKKQRQEQARIMQEEGAFPPLGGCLPMFLQIPVFIGLFQALRTSFDLRQAPFAFWIDDLSMPDRLMHLGFDTHLPIIGTIEWLNILPPVMVALWILQQKVMPKPTDEQALRMQKIMVWMPVMFGFMLYNYAAGLSLYMITTSSLGIFEQTTIKKIWPIDDRERPKKKSGFMQRLAELQEQAQKMQQQQPRGGRRPQVGAGGKRKKR